MLKAFRKLVTSDPDLSKVQDAVAAVLNPLTKIDILNGVILEQLQITTTAQKFAHGLNRPVNGYIITYKSAAADIYCPSLGTDFTITLQASANVTANILVF